MKAILINPEAVLSGGQPIQEVDFGGNYAEIQTIVGDTKLTGSMIGNYLDTVHSKAVDIDEDSDFPKSAFVIVGDDVPFVGRGLIVGHPEDDTVSRYCDVREFTPETLRDVVKLIVCEDNQVSVFEYSSIAEGWVGKPAYEYGDRFTIVSNKLSF